MGGSLCYTMGVILVKTSTGWPLFPWEISPYKTVTQTCGPIRGRRTLAAARPPLTYKHRLQRSICWYPHWTNEQQRLFKRRGACGKTNILKTWISMPFFFFFLTFGSKYTRQTADVELCRQGIEVSHRKWCTVPQGPARWDKTSLSQRFGGCRCDEPGRGLKKKKKKKPCHANDGLTSWRAVIRPAYWLTERQLKGNNECSQDREGPQRSEGGDGDCLGGLGRDSPLSPFLPTFTTHRVRRRQCRPHYRSRPPRLPSPAEQRTRVRDSTKSNLLCTTDGL